MLCWREKGRQGEIECEMLGLESRKSALYAGGVVPWEKFVFFVLVYVCGNIYVCVGVNKCNNPVGTVS